MNTADACGHCCWNSGCCSLGAVLLSLVVLSHDQVGILLWHVHWNTSQLVATTLQSDESTVFCLKLLGMGLYAAYSSLISWDCCNFMEMSSMRCTRLLLSCCTRPTSEACPRGPMLMQMTTVVACSGAAVACGCVTPLQRWVLITLERVHAAVD
jgi:hypothetical protein